MTVEQGNSWHYWKRMIALQQRITSQLSNLHVLMKQDTPPVEYTSTAHPSTLSPRPMSPSHVHQSLDSPIPELGYYMGNYGDPVNPGGAFGSEDGTEFEGRSESGGAGGYVSLCNGRGNVP